jgi:hypothetical protein
MEHLLGYGKVSLAVPKCPLVKRGEVQRDEMYAAPDIALVQFLDELFPRW